MKIRTIHIISLAGLLFCSSCKSNENNVEVRGSDTTENNNQIELIIELKSDIAILHWTQKYRELKLNLESLKLSDKEYWIVSIGNSAKQHLDLKTILETDTDVLSITNNAEVNSR